MQLKSFKIIVITCCYIVIVACLCSCSSDDEMLSTASKLPVEQLYKKANHQLLKANYSKAAKLYQLLETSYPDGVYAKYSLLNMAYAYYNNGQPELATPTIDQFINFYPDDKNMPYALYLKGYIDYSNDNGLLSAFTKQDLAERSDKNIKNAYQSFHQLVTDYPKSIYTNDAIDKVNRLVAALARSELYRARYYMSIEAYIAAINRANILITTYPNSPSVEEALAIEMLAYKTLGDIQVYNQTKEVLALNFPNSQYLHTTWHNQDMRWYLLWH